MATPASTKDNHDDPWELAKARFLEDLEPHEKELFNNATLENLYYSTSNANRDDAEKSKTRGVVRKLGPLVSAIESYGSALDAFAQISPQYLSPIWGSIRVILVITSSYGKFYEKIVDTLGRIGDILPRFRDYERIYNGQKHQRLTQTLSNAYLDIITLCTEFRKSILEQKSSKVRRILKPLSFDKQFDGAIDRFRQHRKNVENEAIICHMIEAAEQRDALLVLQAAERRRNLLTRLSKVDYKYRHGKLKEARHEGTGVWFTSCPEYEEWQTVSTSSVLCCYGIPGCGKSVLVSSVIDSFSVGSTLIFYYCDYADKRTLDPSNVLGVLARQALEKVEIIPETLASEIEQADHDGERLMNHSTALDILRESLALVPGPIYMILDGLDEATEASQNAICNDLRQLIQKSAITIKFLITGREELGSLLMLDSSVPFLRVPVSPNVISIDIEKYVQASTRRRIADGLLVISDPNLEQLIVKELVKGARGMFLWVEFQLHDLCEPESDHGIRLVLQNLPRSLAETYDRLLSKIEGAERRDMIRRMFKWIVCAREPLHVDELREGVAFTLDDREYDPRKLPTDLTRLVRACGNLMVVDEETQVVQLAHHTVQQYLLQPDGSPFQFTIEDANITAGEFCVAYLSFSNFESQVTRYAENRNTDMSALGRIASRGPVIRPDHPGHKVVRVWNTLRNSHLAPIHIDMTRHVPHQKQAWQPTGFGFLHYVTTHWLWHTLAFGAESTDDGTSGHRENRRDRLFKNLILKKQLLFNFRPWGNFSREARHSSSMSLLGWALMANHRYLIKMASSDSLMEPHFSLLEHVWEATCEKFGWCATPSNKQSSSSTPYDLDVHFDDPYDSDSPTLVWLYSRLLWACREGHLEVLKELNLDIYTLNLNMIRYLVIVSAASGNLQMVQYLDRNHRALGQMDDFLVVSKLTNGQALTAIEHAAISGHLDIVTYLARRSTRPGRLFIDANFYSMLMDAAFDDNNISKIESLLVLLDLGLFLDGVRTAELRIDGFYPAKVMTKAVRMGHSEIVRLLLEYGVNPNTPDPDGFLPLIEAIKCSQDIIVSMLLEYKCSLDNTSFGLPLTIAAYLGNTTIARQLIQQGAEVFPESFRIDSAVDLASLHENYPFYINHYSFKGPFNPKICFSPTPLYMACYHGHRSIVELLLNYGAAANFPSPLCLAWMSQSRDSCGKFRYQQDLHLNEPGPLNIWAVVDRRSFWELPITAAMNKGHMDIVEILISSRARRPEEFDFLCGSYFGSLDAQHEKFERLLADSMTTGSLPKSGNKRLHQLDRTSPTIPASRILSVAELEILAAASANIQQEHLDSQLSQLLMEMHIAEPKCPDPLHAALLKAAERQANDLVQALLLAGASISAPDGDGIQIPNPLLVSAARDGNRLLRRALLDVCLTADFSYVKRFKDLCPQEEIKRRELSLQRMVRSTVTDADLNYFGFPDYCKILVFDTVDRAFTKVLYEILLFQSGHSSPLDAALFAAVEHENHEIVRLLCARGANINARRAHDGMTPLIYAAHRGAAKPVIEAILSYNADPKAFDRAGETAFYKAAVNCHFHVVEALVVSGKSTLRELIILLNLCVSIGNPDAWKAIVRRDMHEEVRLKRGDVVPSYNVSRGQYLLKRPCKHIQGLFEVQGPMDPIVQKQ